MASSNERAKAEQKLAAMYRDLSSAHRMLARSHKSGTQEEREHWLDLAQERFDDAEKIGSEVFGGTLRVARYTVDYAPYKRVLDSLLDHYLHKCNLHKVDRLDVVANLRAALATADTEVREG